MSEDSELIEFDSRYCPICGKRIKQGTPLHKCSKKTINKIDKIHDTEEPPKINEERTYADKLEEFEEFYNSETFYDEKDD